MRMKILFANIYEKISGIYIIQIGSPALAKKNQVKKNKIFLKLIE